MCSAKLLQLCDPMDCSLPDSSVHGILQVRILEWSAMSSSREIFPTQGWNQVSCLLHWQVGSLPLAPPGKPFLVKAVGLFWEARGPEFQQAFSSSPHSTSLPSAWCPYSVSQLLFPRWLSWLAGWEQTEWHLWSLLSLQGSSYRVHCSSVKAPRS